jgi:hypothetical protein
LLSGVWKDAERDLIDLRSLALSVDPLECGPVLVAPLIGLLLLRRKPGVRYGMVIHSGTIATVRGDGMPSGGCVVVMWIVGVTTLHSQEMGKPVLPPPLEVVSPSSVESSRIVCSDGDPL